MSPCSTASSAPVVTEKARSAGLMGLLLSSLTVEFILNRLLELVAGFGGTP